MSKPFQRAPFIAINTRTLWDANIHARNIDSKGQDTDNYLNVDGLSDSIGHCSLGDIYWNKECSSFGLVCGNSFKDLNMVVQRLVSSHLQDGDAQVLILHTDNDSVRETPCSLLHEAWPTPRVHISPRKLRCIADAYASMNRSTLPISFEETEITLKHLLAIFTPPSSMRGGSKILNSVEYIVSQLSEPFDLQRFIQLVDEEKWDDEGATFMALRQTLLTALLAPPPDATRNPFWMERISVLDLTDPVLASTGLDTVLMDMALREFVVPVEGTKKLIVLNMAQRYLRGTSSLTKSLISIASEAEDSAVSILISVTDPAAPSPSLLASLGYTFCTDIGMPTWKSFFQSQFGYESGTLPSSINSFESDSLAMWSPKSLRVECSSMGGSIENLWSGHVAFIAVDKLRWSMPTSFERSALFSGHQSPSTAATLEKYDTEVAIEQDVVKKDTPSIPVMQLEESANLVSPMASRSPEKSTSSPIVPEMSTEEEDIPIPDTIRSSPAVLMSREDNEESNALASTNGDVTTIKSQQPMHSPEPTVRHETSIFFKIKAKDYPKKFRPLISAVLTESAGYANVWVDFEAVQTRLGKMEAVKKLGWTTYTQYVQTACGAGHLQMKLAENNPKRIKLVAPNVNRDEMKNHLEESNPLNENSAQPTLPANSTLFSNPESQLIPPGAVAEVTQFIPNEQDIVPSSREDVPSLVFVTETSNTLLTVESAQAPGNQQGSASEPRPDNSYQGALTYFLSSLPVQAYPLRFRLLISAISVLSKGRAVMVDYNKVCQLIGGERKIRDLGFMSYQQLVETACAEGHADQGNYGAWKWVGLRKPLPVENCTPVTECTTLQGSWSNPTSVGIVDTTNTADLRTPALQLGKKVTAPPTNTSPPLSNLSAESYPVQYRGLASAILKLSGGRLGVKVDNKGVRNLVGERKKIRQLNAGFSSYKQLLQGACAEGYAEQGRRGSQKWVMLLEAVSKAHSSQTNRIDQSGSTQRSPFVAVPSSIPTPPVDVRQTTYNGSSTEAQATYEDLITQAKSGTTTIRPTLSHVLQVHDYPSQHQVLVSAILLLSGGRTHTKTRYFQILNIIRGVDAFATMDTKALVPIIIKASNDGVVLYGVDERGIWVALENPASVAVVSQR